MTIDNSANLLDAVTKLLGVFVWPEVAVVVLIRFGAALREFIADMEKFELQRRSSRASWK
jgi:hypothetical protein